MNRPVLTQFEYQIFSNKLSQSKNSPKLTNSIFFCCCENFKCANIFMAKIKQEFKTVFPWWVQLPNQEHFLIASMKTNANCWISDGQFVNTIYSFGKFRNCIFNWLYLLASK